MIVLMAVLTFALSVRPMDATALFRNGALVQAFPIVAGILLTTVQDRQLNLSYARYGPFFAWFVLMALATESPSKTESRGTPAIISQRSHASGSAV